MHSPRVEILMGVYDGEKYLAEQLDSLIAQTHEDWHLNIAIDKSDDNSLNIIKSYQSKLGNNKISIGNGSGMGFFQTFMKLLANVDPQTQYAAFCDQDDIWHPDKLSTAIRHLQDIHPDQPAIYCGRTRLVNQQGKFLGYSPLFSKRPGFENALVQSIAGGNTMVFNRPAIQLLSTIPHHQKLPGHDWWAYLLITGVGGTVIYDPIPKIDYRQHQGNLIGGNQGLKNRVKRLSLLFSGRYRRWMDTNMQALAERSDDLTPENQILYNHFSHYRRAKGLKRINTIRKLSLRRQTLMGTVSLYLGMLINRI